MDTMLLDCVTAEKISDNMPSDGALSKLAGFFSALSDVTRLKILTALSASCMCVTDIATLTGINQSTVSHQLRLLKSERLVECKRQGKVMFYSVTGKGFADIMDIAVGEVF